MQEALPGQVHVVYLVQPGQFWQKQQTTRGHNREKAKLEFTVSDKWVGFTLPLLDIGQLMLGLSICLFKH